jgi:hypothetical protein
MIDAQQEAGSRKQVLTKSASRLLLPVIGLSHLIVNAFYLK